MNVSTFEERRRNHATASTEWKDVGKAVSCAASLAVAGRGPRLGCLLVRRCEDCAPNKVTYMTKQTNLHF